MTNQKAIEALNLVKNYTAAELIDGLDYAIQVLEKLEKEGVKKPLTTDFTKIKEQEK